MIVRETNLNLLLQKVKDFKNLPTSFFCSSKVSSKDTNILGKFKYRAANQEGWKRLRKEAFSRLERKGWASSILSGGQQTPLIHCTLSPPAPTQGRKEWAGEAGSTGGMVKTDKGAKGGCTKIKNKGSSHHRQTVADREESWVRQLAGAHYLVLQNQRRSFPLPGKQQNPG